LGTGFQDRSFPFPLIFAVVAWILAACWLVFPRNLAGAPRIEVLSGSGEVLFFRTARGTVSRILRRDEIARFAEEIQLYPSRGHPTKNHVLSLFTVGGAKVPLCASPEEPLIRALESEISRVTGVAGS
jgi:hypothetical protein